MLCSSHLEISNVVLDEVGKEGIILDKGMYLLGSAIPDFNPYYKCIRHYNKYSCNYLKKVISSLNFENRKETSFRLGVIGHYLTDYFCYPHYNNLTLNKNWGEHTRYENGLNKFIKRYRFDCLGIKKYRFDNFNKLLDASYNLYSNKESFIEDIKVSLWVNENLLLNVCNW